MICPKCKRIISSFDDTCQHCGTSLKNNIIKDYAKKADEKIGKGEVGEEIKEADLRSLGRQKTSYVLNNFPPFRHYTEADMNELMRGIQFEFNPAHLNESLAPKDKEYVKEFDKELVKEFDIVDLVQVSYMMFKIYSVDVLFKDSLFGHPCVELNTNHYQKFGITDFSYHEFNANVDVSALYDQQTRRYKLNLYDGYLDFMFALEWFFIVRQFNKGGEEQTLLKMLADLLSKNNEFKPGFALGIATIYLDKDPTFKNYYIAHFLKIMEKAFISISMTVVHELGHICLGHYGNENVFLHQDIKANQELEADSFASSIVTSLFPERFKQELVLANVKSEFAWVLRDRIFGAGVLGKKEQVTTHPHSKERLINAIRANQKMTQDHSINEAWIDKTIDLAVSHVERR